ncbi:MAG: hypothetical protein R3B58_03370 [Phycisphaerales bacterium]
MTPARTMCRYIAGSLSYAITITANAQCAPVWLPIGSGPVSGISATTLLPNDNLVVGGTFSVSVSGGVQASNIAQWDGDEWFAMGTGMGGTVYALTTLATGDVVAGGSFMTSDGVYTNRIARWDGSFWHPYIASNGSVGIDGTVRAVAALPSGDLIAGGLSIGWRYLRLEHRKMDGTDWQPRNWH